MKLEEMEYFKREFLPHIYFIMALLLLFSVIGQAIPVAYQFLTYQAIIWWLVVFAWYGYVKRLLTKVYLFIKHIFIPEK